MSSDYLDRTAQLVREGEIQLAEVEDRISLLKETGETTSQYEGDLIKLKGKLAKWRSALNKRGVM